MQNGTPGYLHKQIKWIIWLETHPTQEVVPHKFWGRTEVGLLLGSSNSSHRTLQFQHVGLTEVNIYTLTSPRLPGTICTPRNITFQSSPLNRWFDEILRTLSLFCNYFYPTAIIEGEMFCAACGVGNYKQALGERNLNWMLYEIWISHADADEDSGFPSCRRRSGGP